MTEIIVAIIGSGALSTLISLVVTTLSRKKTIEEGVQFLLLGEIERQGTKHIDRGEIRADDYAQFDALYTVYKKLGGNGYAARIKEAVDDLPLKK